MQRPSQQVQEAPETPVGAATSWGYQGWEQQPFRLEPLTLSAPRPARGTRAGGGGPLPTAVWGRGGSSSAPPLPLQELEAWTTDFALPTTVWLAGFFNPQSFLTAIMQSMARKNEWPLDKMCLSVEVTKKNREDMTAPPREGSYVYGLFMEGSWRGRHRALEPGVPSEGGGPEASPTPHPRAWQPGPPRSPVRGHHVARSQQPQGGSRPALTQPPPCPAPSEAGQDRSELSASPSPATDVTPVVGVSGPLPTSPEISTAAGVLHVYCGITGNLSVIK